MSQQGLLRTTFNTAQLFLGDNHWEQVEYTNSTGSEVTINAGRLMGKILATNKVLPHVAAATDGSEMPIGVAGEKYVVADGATINMYIVTQGHVNQNGLLLNGSETLATVVRTVSTGGGTIGDLIRRNTMITLIESAQLSGYDN